MTGQDVPETTPTLTSNLSACLVQGCTCKDARIVSPRRAAYFASIARLRGETAERVVAADPSWAIPVASDIDLGVDLAA